MPSHMERSKRVDDTTGAEIVIVAGGAGDMLDSAESIDRISAGFLGNTNFGAGVACGYRVAVRSAGPFTKVRFLAAGAAPAGLTDLRFGVWDAAGIKLAESANMIATVVAAGLYDIPLLTPVAPSPGDILFAGAGQVGGATPLSWQGSSTNAAFVNELPVTCRTQGGYAGGALPNLGTARGDRCAWVKLVP